MAEVVAELTTVKRRARCDMDRSTKDFLKCLKNSLCRGYCKNVTFARLFYFPRTSNRTFRLEKALKAQNPHNVDIMRV